MTFGVVGLDPVPFEVNGDDVVEFPYSSDLAHLVVAHSTLTGLAFDVTADPALRAQCDFIDGIASRTGVIDTVAFQPAGASHLVVGFAALPGALGRALTDVLGAHAGKRGTTTAAILGAGDAAACAIAAAVQHGYSSIVLASDVPGTAVGAAHRMDIDVEMVRIASLAGAQVDLLINTLDERIENEPDAVCDLTGAWDGFSGPYVSPQLVRAHQRQDQVRVLTGKSPNLETLLDLV